MTGNRIYVGNVPYSITEAELREAFGAHGEVSSINIVTDRETGKARGFAFVEMTDSVAAGQAIRALDGQELGGRKLVVNQAREREPRGGRDRSRDRY